MTRRVPRRALALVPALFLAATGATDATDVLAPAPRAAVLVSRPDGDGGRSDGSSYHTAISADGRYVTFMSFARNLVTDDSNGRYDIFVRDVIVGRTLLASRADGEHGAVSNGRSSWPAVSADGRFVAFQSFASNLVAGDGNGRADVFERDLRRATTTLVSRGAGGLGDGNSLDPAISAGGRFVAFQSFAGNLTPGDRNGRADVFVRDMQAGVTGLVSAARAGGGGNGASDNPSISADGRYVAFESDASDLVAGDFNHRSDVFVRDMLTGGTRLVSRARRRAESGDGPSYMPSISADGRYVAFASRASDLVGGDANGAEDVFVFDRRSGRMRLASRHAEGGSTSRTVYPSISADGRYVVFHSDAPDIVRGDANRAGDVFLRDLVAGRTRAVSRP